VDSEGGVRRESLLLFDRSYRAVHPIAMAALSRLARAVTRDQAGFRGALYSATREVGGAAQATTDMEFYSSPLARTAHDRQQHRQEERNRGPQWVFLGCPGVGKGTYASRLSKLVDVPHIAMGDLVREELKSKSSLSKQVGSTVLALI
jgi:adenylate kinase